MAETPTAPTCQHCGVDIGYLSTAGATVIVGDLEFCSEGCAEAWLDFASDTDG